MSFSMGSKENAYKTFQSRGSIMSDMTAYAAEKASGSHVLRQSNNQTHKLHCELIPCNYSGVMKVYVQGDIDNRAGKVVFLTVHDVGTNHNSIIPFVENSYMKEVKKKSVWLHVCLPGQDDNEEILPEKYEFPTLDGLAHDLVYVLDHFNVKTIIAFGEGAGANILCRFGLFYPNRVLGLVLIDCTSSTAGVDEYIKLKVLNWKEGGAKLADKVLKYLTYHKAGYAAASNWKEHILSENLCKYLDVYIKRTDISKLVAKELNAESCVLAGSRCVESVRASKRMVDGMDMRHTTLLIVDDVYDVVAQAPKNLSRALILFCKGCSMLLGVPMIGLEKEYQAIKQSSLPQSITQQSIAKAVLKNEWNMGDIHDGEYPTGKQKWDDYDDAFGCDCE